MAKPRPSSTFIVERRNVRRVILWDPYHVLLDRDSSHRLGLLAASYTVANLDDLVPMGTRSVGS